MCTRTHARAHTAFKAKGLISDAPVGEDGAEEWAGPAGCAGPGEGTRGKTRRKVFREGEQSPPPELLKHQEHEDRPGDGLARWEPRVTNNQSERNVTYCRAEGTAAPYPASAVKTTQTSPPHSVTGPQRPPSGRERKALPGRTHLRGDGLEMPFTQKVRDVMKLQWRATRGWGGLNPTPPRKHPTPTHPSTKTPSPVTLHERPLPP